MADFAFGSLSTDEKRLAVLKEWRNGVKHHSLIMPRAPQATDQPTLTVMVGLDVVIDRVECVLLEPETAVYQFTLQKNEWDILNWRYAQTWTATLPAFAHKSIVRYKICAYPADGSEPIWADDDELFSYYVGVGDPPAWSHNAIIYQIFPDRFAMGNGRSWPQTDDLNEIHGGTIRGIIEKLDYIADMGFNCIWINPFLPDSTHHRYHATNYYAVDPTIGTLDDVRELVEKAHAKGIKLLFDFVANHWGIDHAIEIDGKQIKTFEEATASQDSPYYNWYKWIEWPKDWWSFFGVRDLPEVNVNYPEVRDYLLKSALFWLCDMGFDGLRLDYALGPSHDFWTDLYATVKQNKPDAWLFGEVVETPVTIRRYEGHLDGCLDFPLMQAMKDTFAFRQMSLSAFDTFLHNHFNFFSERFTLPSFLDNHDMNRFLFAADGDENKLKLALMCLFTLPGSPIIYYGTEIGLTQRVAMADPSGDGMAEARKPMPWGEEAYNSTLKSYIKRLIDLRRAHPALVFGSRQTLHCDNQTETYVYGRSHENDHVIVALNLSQSPQTITVTNPANGKEHIFSLAPMSGAIQ